MTKTSLLAAIAGGLAAGALTLAGPAGAVTRGADGAGAGTDSTASSSPTTDPQLEQAYYNDVRSGRYGIAPPPGVTSDIGTDDLATLQAPDPTDLPDLASLDHYGIAP